MPATVTAVHARGTHAFSKETVPAISLIAGQGVAGDAHCGVTVKHRSRVARDPSQPNLRQVHLMHSELFDELARKGLPVVAGQMGENITTAGLDLLGLSEGTVLRIGERALVQITGLRNPCAQIDNFMPGLMAAVLDRDADGALVRKAGVMGIVLATGEVRAGDAIALVRVPAQGHALRPV
jgi:MOSC domain-containing protein YiiM